MDRPLYNSRVIDSYIKLIKKKYSHIDIAGLLKYAGMESYEVEDQGHWFTQTQINRFHEKLSQETHQQNISREAGRFSASPEAMGLVRKYLIGLVTPGQAYSLIGKSASKLTRSTTVESKQLSPNKVEITFTQESEVKEEPFQCESRFGFLEAITLALTNKLPHIDHPQCIFKGDKICRYIISWEIALSARLKRLRNIAFILLYLACLIFSFVVPHFSVFTLLPIATAIAFILAYIAEFVERKELKTMLNEEFDTVDKLVDQINETYNNAFLTYEFGQAISRQTNIDDILKNVVEILNNQLKYDRGIILLADSTKTRLDLRTGFGFTDDDLKFLEGLWSDLKTSHSASVFTVSFHDQKPYLINDIDSIKEDTIIDSMRILQTSGSKAFVCCPIVIDGESIGVLAVDHVTEKRPLVQSDMSLLQGFAPVIGSHIRNEEEKDRLYSKLQVAAKMESIGTLAGGIAHDFNNLLMGIQGRASLMMMNKNHSDKDYEHLKEIDEYVHSASNLTKQLLGFARGGKYNAISTDLNELIEKQNVMFGRTRKEISIAGIYEPDIWAVAVDPGQIEQVLINLFVNAWQAMPDGGNIYVQTQNVIIDEADGKLYKVSPGRYVKISVRDTGIGMDKKTQSRIFDPFFTTKERGRGTGLGLASVYGIVKNHTGFVNVYSEINEGTTFNIYLPVTEKEIDRTEVASETISPGSEAILLVDDEEFITVVGKRLLDKLGYKVFTASSGMEAIEVYADHKDEIDLIILDMVMPEMGGGKTFERLKEISPDVKVLLASGYSLEGQAADIMEKGCKGFIQKPFTLNELSQKLREILDQN